MDTSKSLQELQELENKDWGEPDDAPTSLVRKCLALRRVPIRELSAENCRMLLGQNIGTIYVLPIAFEFLVGNPMESGDFYEGALLRNILELPAEFWIKEQELWWQVNEIVGSLEILRQSIDDLAPQIKTFQTLQAK